VEKAVVGQEEDDLRSGGSDLDQEESTRDRVPIGSGEETAEASAKLPKQASKSKAVIDDETFVGEEEDVGPRGRKNGTAKSNTVSPKRPRRVARKQGSKQPTVEADSDDDSFRDPSTRSRQQDEEAEDLTQGEERDDTPARKNEPRVSRGEPMVVIPSKPRSSRGRQSTGASSDKQDGETAMVTEDAAPSEHDPFYGIEAADDLPTPDVESAPERATDGDHAHPSDDAANKAPPPVAGPATPSKTISAPPKRVIALSSNPPQSGPIPSDAAPAKSKQLGAVPQVSPSTFRPFLPGSSQTEKSLPNSQVDPIDEWSSPLSKGATQERAKRKAGEDANEDGEEDESDGEEQIVAKVRFVERVIDGEVWVTSSHSLDDPAADEADDGTEGEAVGMEFDAGGPAEDQDDDDLEALNSVCPAYCARRTADSKPQTSPAKLVSKSTEKTIQQTLDTAEITAEKAALASQLAEKDATITDLQSQLQTLTVKLDAQVAQPVTDPAVNQERNAKINELEAHAAELQQQLMVATATPPVDSTLLAQKDATIKQLYIDISELQVKLASAPTEAADNSSSDPELAKKSERIVFLIAECDTLTTRLEDVQSTLERANDKNQTLSEENDFFRAQYSLASNQAVASVRKVNDLEAQVEKLQKQLTLGLKQRNMHYEAIHAKREVEMDKLRKSNEFLLAQSRRTDDTTRRKATLYDRYKEHNDRLVDENHTLNRRYNALQERNEELADMNAALRGEKMGAFGGAEVGASGSEWSEGDAEEDMTDDGSVVGTNARGVEYHTRSLGSDLLPGESQLGPIISGSSPFAGAAMAIGDDGAETEVEAIVEGGEGFRCKWRVGESQCVLMFDDKAVSV